MSINVCGLISPLGLVMQNDLFSLSFPNCLFFFCVVVRVVYRDVDLFYVYLLPTVSSHHHQREIYYCIMTLCFVFFSLV